MNLREEFERFLYFFLNLKKKLLILGSILLCGLFLFVMICDFFGIRFKFCYIIFEFLVNKCFVL